MSYDPLNFLDNELHDLYETEGRPMRTQYDHDDDFYANDPSIDELEELIHDEEDDDLSYDDDAFPDDHEAGEDADWDD